VCLSGLGRVGLDLGGDVPRQQFLDAVDWMPGDRRQNCAQIERRIESIQLGCPDEAVEQCCSLAAGVSSHEKVILPFMQIFA